ncbi:MULTISPECIES: hypothetical protein [Paracoccus]|uniref:hypothetical protein n=1 Tax=Paracoccus TaxID=265 RepID=UPI0008683277|nr:MULTISPECIES: hypothetical protein [Paracoccus]ODT60919.1 MAG: hypothetical protein ABS73_03490 [Paracoccus sp. SCN 68-21]
MRRLLAALLLTACPAGAQEVSDLIARDGLSGARAALEAQVPAPDRDLALATTRFLGGIEAAFHARHRIGATDPLVPLPLLGASLPPNPDPQPMTADFITAMMRDLSVAMQDTRDALPDAPATLILDLRDLWLDVDGDGTRGAGEDLIALAALPPPEGGAQIRFDGADIHWLRAYTHLIEGVATLILAFDPEPALAGRIALDAALADQFAQPPGQMARAPTFDSQAQAFGPVLDRIAVVLQTLRQQPDPALTRAAGDHLRAMVAANRLFWAEVAQETDNDREWIPNEAQDAALGFDLPPGTGPLWLSILEEVDQALEGRMLIPHWRMAPGHGVDLAMWLDDPRPVDVIDWLQGSAALPYARPGLTVGRDNWDRFVDSLGGRAGLYMLLLN